MAMEKKKESKKKENEQKQDDQQEEAVEELSALEKEIATLSDEFSIREVPPTSQVTPVLQPVETSQETGNSLETQVFQERPEKEKQDERTTRSGAEYLGSSSTADYVSASGTDFSRRRGEGTSGSYVTQLDRQRPEFDSKNFDARDSRLKENLDPFHHVADIGGVKYERKHLPFERKEQEYYSFE